MTNIFGMRIQYPRRNYAIVVFPKVQISSFDRELHVEWSHPQNLASFSHHWASSCEVIQTGRKIMDE